MGKTGRSLADVNGGNAAGNNVPVAVLVSGGLDSAILLGELAVKARDVQPIYIRCGLNWESVELRYLRAYLATIGSTRPLVTLEVPVADMYDDHWSLSGRSVPNQDTSDAAVYLPGRNILLLGKSTIWCHLNQVEQLALAVLECNPFDDATPAFFEEFEHAVNRAINGSVRIIRPYASTSKIEVLRRGRDLPLKLTFSCINPVDGNHCGVCNKCAERQRAFAAAGVPDETLYAKGNSCTA